MSVRPADRLPPGTVVGGRFRIERLLGEGGYGCVYEATQLNLARPVALKIMHADVLRRPAALARFEREALLTQQLSHPNVVRLFDFGRTEQGIPFIVWELLVGRSLEREIASAGALPASRVHHIAQQVVKGLMEAHSLGIVHRDVKPANIFLSDFAGEPDFVKVLDFGIALAPSGSGAITQDGVSLGTPAYMAPEQVMDQAIDGRTDLYSLGLVMAEMLSGEPVFRGATAMQVAMMQIEERPVPLSPVVSSSPLGPVIARATQKDPNKRFSSAFEMLEVLRSAERAVSVPPRTGSPSMVTGPTQAGYTELSTGPTQAVIPIAHAPHTAVSPVGRSAPPPQGTTATLGVQIVQRGAPPPAWSSWPAVAIAAGALAALAGVGWLGLTLWSAGPAKHDKEEEREKRASRDPEQDLEDAIDQAVEDAVKIGPDGIDFKVPGATVKVAGCGATAKLASFTISGVDGRTLLGRLEPLGYSCLTITETTVLGEVEYGVSLQKKRSGGAMLTFRKKLLVEACTGGAYAKDPDTNVNVCIMGPDREEAKRMMKAMFGSAQ